MGNRLLVHFLEYSDFNPEMKPVFDNLTPIDNILDYNLGLGRKPHKADDTLIVLSTLVMKFTVGPKMGGQGSLSSILMSECYDM